MSKRNDTQQNDVRREAATLAKIVIYVLNMKQRTFVDIVTVFGYMVCAFISAIAATQGHNHDKEMEKFIDYLTDIWASESKEMNSVSKANIIKLN